MKTTKHLLIVILLSLFTGLCNSARADISSGLVTYLKMDETSGLTAYDSTANGLNVSLGNFPGDNSQWVIGRTNGGLNFLEADSEYGNITDSGVLNFGTNSTDIAFTYSVWVRGVPGSYINGTAVFGKGNSGGGEEGALDLVNNTYRFFCRDSTGASAQYINDVRPSIGPNGLWQHLAVVFDASSTNTVKFYINGALAAQSTNATPLTLLTGAVPLYLGSRPNGSGIPAYFFNGTFDEFRIYNRALSASDVLQLFQSPGPLAPIVLTQPASASVFVGDPVTFSVAADGTLPITYQWSLNGTNINGATNQTFTINSVQLTNAGMYSVTLTNAGGLMISSNATLAVSNPAPNLNNGLDALLKMDETSGLVASDSTGNGNNASLIGFADDNSQWVAGRNLGALFFTNGEYATIDGSAGQLDFSTNLYPAFSIAVWVKGVPGITVSNAGIVTKGTGGGGEEYSLDVNNGVYRFFLRDGTGTNVYGFSTTNIVDGSWQYLVAVYNNTNLEKLYVNGQLAGSIPNGPATLFSNTHEVSIADQQSGTALYDRPFSGTIDDLRFYNRPLTPTEVSLLYTNAGVYGPAIVTGPVNTTNYVLAPASLSVIADGTVPLFYQWRQNGTNILNATNTTLTYAVSQLTNSGAYTVVVTNLYGGSVTSAPANFVVVNLATNDYTSALVAEWSFDETTGTIVHDSTVNNNLLNLGNYPGNDSQWVTTARIGGRALRFNATADDATSGTNEYAMTASGFAMPYDYNNFTFAYWCKLDNSTYGSNPRIITPTIRPWALFSSAGGMRIYNGTTGAAANPKLNQWTHYAIVYNRASAIFTIYTNGVLMAANISVEAKTAPTAATQWVIGHNETIAAAGDYWRGQLDDVRIYNRLLTASQVAALYAAAPSFIQISAQPQSMTVNERNAVSLVAAGDSSLPLSYQWLKNSLAIPGATNGTLSFAYIGTNDVGLYSLMVSNSLGVLTSSAATLTVVPLPAANLTNSLVFYYTFDETSGTTAHDSSGNGNDATLNNWVPGAVTWEPGIIGNALHFNTLTTNNYVLTPGPLAGIGNNTNYSFSFWAKRDPTNTLIGNPKIIEPYADPNASWVMWKPGSGVGFWNGSWAEPEPATNTWHHYVVTFNRITSVYNVYVDGVRTVQGGIPTNPAFETDPTAYPWVIGHLSNIDLPDNSESFRGWLDDVRLYNRILSLNDVETLYETGNVQPTFSSVSSVNVSGGNITISWPSWAADYVLQSTTNLSAAVWTTVPGTPSLSGVIRSQPDGIGTGQKFYRLVKP